MAADPTMEHMHKRLRALLVGGEREEADQTIQEFQAKCAHNFAHLSSFGDPYRRVRSLADRLQAKPTEAVRIQDWSEWDDITHMSSEWLLERYIWLDLVMSHNEGVSVGVCKRCGSIVAGLITHAREVHGDMIRFEDEF